MAPLTIPKIYLDELRTNSIFFRSITISAVGCTNCLGSINDKCSKRELENSNDGEFFTVVVVTDAGNFGSKIDPQRFTIF